MEIKAFLFTFMDFFIYIYVFICFLSIWKKEENY